jgi:hypothetical protein
MCNQEWMIIEEFPEYEINNIGMVRRGLIIKSLISDRKGYLSVKLWKGGIQHKRTIARLMYVAFHGEIKDGMVVRHKNGIKTDNRIANLEIGTYAQNEADKIKHGTRFFGENHHQSKLSKYEVDEIKNSYVRGSRIYGSRALAKKYGISGVQVLNIVHGKSWAD